MVKSFPSKMVKLGAYVSHLTHLLWSDVHSAACLNALLAERLKTAVVIAYSLAGRSEIRQQDPGDPVVERLHLAARLLRRASPGIGPERVTRRRWERLLEVKGTTSVRKDRLLQMDLESIGDSQSSLAAGDRSSVLVFDPQDDGHHPDYVFRFLRYICEQSVTGVVHSGVHDNIMPASGPWRFLPPEESLADNPQPRGYALMDSDSTSQSLGERVN